MRIGWLAVLIGWCVFSLMACRIDLLKEALKGNLRPEERNNEVIIEYCHTCHIHRTFEPISHIPRMQALYDGPPYNIATQCSTCHLVKRNTWGIRRRKTIWPADVAQPAFEE